MKAEQDSLVASHLAQPLKSEWEAQGFDQPTPIQAAAWPRILKGDNLLALSATGTGKTLAYLLASFNQVQAQAGLQLIILAPSQELASQIASVARPWAQSLDLKLQLVIGGANIKRQIDQLKAKPEIVVASPGRINELIEQRKLKVHQVKYLVCDEVDDLLKADSLPLFTDLIKRLPKYRQNIAFGATITQDSLTKAKELLAIDQVIDLRQDLSSQANLHHGYLLTPVRKRVDRLRSLAQLADFRALVFVRTKADVDLLEEKLSYHGLPVASLHAEMSGQDRQRVIQAFNRGQLVYLFTTDLASRGLDIPDLACVIQYDLAKDQATYVHRSGRTGRMGQKGLVLTFCNNDRTLRELKQVLPEGTELEEYYLYQGQLVKAASQPQPAGHDQANRRAKKPQSFKRAAPSADQSAGKGKKKKNRKRQQKNKGARRKKAKKNWSPRKTSLE